MEDDHIKYICACVHFTNLCKNCSCGSCEDDKIECDGEDYHSKNLLTCPFHVLAYEVETLHHMPHKLFILN